MIKLKTLYIGLLCFCILNNGVNGVLFSLIAAGAPVMLSAVLFFSSPAPAQGQLLGGPNSPDYSGGGGGGSDLGNAGGSILGNIVGNVLGGPSYDYYGNGPGSVPLNALSLVRNSLWGFLRQINEVLARVFNVARMIFLTALRMMNEVIAHIPKFLIHNAFFRAAHGVLHSLLSPIIRTASLLRPNLLGALKGGSNLARISSNALNTIKNLAGGKLRNLGKGGGFLKNGFNLLRNGIINSFKNAVRFRLQEFRFKINHLPGNVLNGLKNIGGATKNAAGVVKGLTEKFKDIFSKFKNGLVNTLIKKPLNLIKNIISKFVNLLQNITGRIAKFLSPGILKFILAKKPFESLLGGLENFKKKFGKLGSNMLAPLKNIIGSIRNIVKSMRGRAGETLRDIITAFIVSRAKPSGGMFKPFKRIRKAISEAKQSIMNLMNGIKKVFGEGALGIVRRIISQIAGMLKNLRNSLPTPRNLLKHVLSGIGGRTKLFRRLKNLPTNILNIASIISNVRSKHRSVSVNIQNDINNIKEGLRQIVFKLMSKVGANSGLVGKIISWLIGRVTSAGGNRTSLLSIFAGFLNRFTGAIKGGTRGISAKLSQFLQDIGYVIGPLFDNKNL